MLVPLEVTRELWGDRSIRGERHHLAKLRADDVRWVRAWAAEGYGSAALAQTFGVSAQNIWNIVNGRTWKVLVDLPRCKRAQGVKVRLRARERASMQTRSRTELGPGENHG